MKITFLTPALVAILGLAFAGAPITAQAQTSTDTAPAAAPDTTAVAPKAKTKSKKTPYSGSITAIDATSITVASTQKTLTMAITPKTSFKKDKASATAADFAVGDQVTGSYMKDSSGALTAASIHKKTTTPPAAQ